MSIEEELLSSYLIEESKLIDYGFQSTGGKLRYTKALPKENLTILLEYDGTIRGTVMDPAIGEEYTNFRAENASGFRAEVRQQFTDLLLDIRETCCRNRFFRSEQARRISDFIFDSYHDTPDFLWPGIPSYGAFRKEKNKKWYAIIGSVPWKKIDRASNSNREVEVINVKVDKGRINSFLSRNGFFPAYHMSKKTWVSIILDDTISDAEIQSLIQDSYENT